MRVLHENIKNALNAILCLLWTAKELLIGIQNAAKSGRNLPRLTLLLLVHSLAHLILLPPYSTQLTGNKDLETWWRLSSYVLITNVALNTIGYTFLVLLYRHSVRVIFNRNIPTYSANFDTTSSKTNTSLKWPQPHPAIHSFNVHLLMLRPLEILFRFLTAPFRVLPDVLILGETRCGTTTLCSHITSLSSTSANNLKPNNDIGKGKQSRPKIKCYTPFCPWAHPELDGKESFYFVGHYLGMVDPCFFRMAFPLKITRWWEERVLGNIFLCFDGCAQYLTSPSAPYLIAAAYQCSSCWNQQRHLGHGIKSRCDKCLPPPVLVACVRNPVDQAYSWWKYENNAICWGEGMGLTEWNTKLRSSNYPPTSIGIALQFSMSDYVENAYLEAEKLTKNLVGYRCRNLESESRTRTHSGQTGFERADANNSANGFVVEKQKSGTNSSLLSIFKKIIFLPEWAITWPVGQLSTIGRSGRYSSNITRYNNVFQSVFGGMNNILSARRSDAKETSTPISEKACTKCKLSIITGCCCEPTNGFKRNQNFVHIVPLESQSNGALLKSSLRPVFSDVVSNIAYRTRQSYATLMPHMDSAIDAYMSENLNAFRRNIGTMLSSSELEPSDDDLNKLKNHFGAEAKELERITGKKLNWTSST